jgi:biopolymer transport protein ExbD
MAFAPSKAKKNPKREAGGLSMTSMMDMMTIILLFLLVNMSTSGSVTQPSAYLDLPTASRDLTVKKDLALLVTCNPNLGAPAGVLEDMVDNPRLLSSINELESDVMILPTLESYLNEKRDFQIRAGMPFKGVVTIQSDKAVPYDWILKVINTCGQSEFSTIDFIVVKDKQF